jgi:hypothetical protein
VHFLSDYSGRLRMGVNLKMGIQSRFTAGEPHRHSRMLLAGIQPSAAPTGFPPSRE